MGKAAASMEVRNVGSIPVSVVGLGCNNFGWQIESNAAASAWKLSADQLAEVDSITAPEAFPNDPNKE